MRPRYETAEDRRAEAEVALKVASLFQLTPRKLPEQYRVDYALLDERGYPKMFVEVKCRAVLKATYPTLILSMMKADAGRRMTAMTGLPFIVAASWKDCAGMAWINPDRPPGPLRYGGRKDRGDWQDMEPCYEIDVERFVPLDDSGRKALFG